MKEQLKIFAFDYSYEGAVVIVAPSKEEALRLFRQKCEEKDLTELLDGVSLWGIYEYPIKDGLLFTLTGDTHLCDKFEEGKNG